MSEIARMTKYTKIEQMAHEMSLTLTTKLFLGSLRASRAIKKQNNYFLVAGCPDSLRVEILGVDEGVDI